GPLYIQGQGEPCLQERSASPEVLLQPNEHNRSRPTRYNIQGAALAAMRASRCLAPASRVIAAEAAPTGRLRSYNPSSNSR
ncbi:hypothetical protein DMX05_15420, partial [Pseudomonas soli]